MTFLISMVPVLELRGAIPIGVAHGLDYRIAIAVSILGNLVPVPFIVLFIRKIFAWLRTKSERLNAFVTRMEQRALKKSDTVRRARFWGLFIFVAIPLPGTTATKGMIDAELMAKMKDGAILLNVGRGMIVDTDALCAALENGKLAGAGVDVTDPEPLPADHPLWKMENAVITPHISGGYHLQETHDRIVRIMAENLKRFLAGEPLRNVVDFSTGYRKL